MSDANYKPLIRYKCGYSVEQIKDFVNTIRNALAVGDLSIDAHEIGSALYSWDMHGEDHPTGCEMWIDIVSAVLDDGNDLDLGFAKAHDACTANWNAGLLKHKRNAHDLKHWARKAKAIKQKKEDSTPKPKKNAPSTRNEPSELDLGAMFVNQTPALKYSSISGTKDIWLWHDGTKYLVGGKANIYARSAAKKFVIDNAGSNKQTISMADRMLSNAKSMPQICVEPNEIDANGYMLCWNDGYLDASGIKSLPKTPKIKPEPEHMVTKLLSGSYPAAQAKCSKFDKFLNDVYCEDKGLIDYEQLRGGYDMLGLTEEHKLHFLEGGGCNGKSTLIAILLGMMGDYGKAFRPSLICGKDDADRFSTAALQGVRLAVISELSGFLNTDKIKNITGGDTVEAERKFQDTFNFEPAASLLISVNTMPVLNMIDYAIRRRIRIIPFNREFSKKEIVKSLSKKILNEELEGLTRFYLHGMMRYLRGETLDDMPDAIAKATGDYLDEQDIVGNWLRDRCKVMDMYEDSAERLYQSFKSYSIDAGIKNPKSKKSLGAALRKQHGVKSYHRNIGDWWVGIRLKTDNELKQPEDTEAEESFLA